jgi:Fe2+ or Zn2+ uptake regulation protein
MVYKDPLMMRVSEDLRMYGIYLTQKKMIVLKSLALCREFVDADSLYLKLRNDRINISRSTVFNTLSLLTQFGLLQTNTALRDKGRHHRLFRYGTKTELREESEHDGRR